MTRTLDCRNGQEDHAARERTLSRFFTSHHLGGILAPEAPCERVPEIQGECIKVPAPGKQLLIASGERCPGLFKSLVNLASAFLPRRKAIQLTAKLCLPRQNTRVLCVVVDGDGVLGSSLD